MGARPANYLTKQQVDIVFVRQSVWGFWGVLPRHEYRSLREPRGSIGSRMQWLSARIRVRHLCYQSGQLAANPEWSIEVAMGYFGEAPGGAGNQDSLGAESDYVGGGYSPFA